MVDALTYRSNGSKRPMRRLGIYYVYGPANDAVERFVDALTIERLVLYLKEPKRKQACWSCADWPQVGYKLTSLNILIVKVRNWSMERAL